MVDVTTDQHFTNVVLSITDKNGVSAKVDGIPVWASSDETVLHPVPNADGMGGSVETVGAGTARITITADADLGTGTATITGVSDDIVVTLGVQPAAVMKLDLGPITPKV